MAVRSQKIQANLLHSPIWWRVSDARSFVEISLSEGQRFRSIEIQHIVKDGITGIVVFFSQPTWELDILTTPGLNYDEEWFRTNPFTAHLKFGSIKEAEFRTAKCDVSPRHVDVEIDVDDASVARIQVKVKQTFNKISPPFFTPATRQSVKHPLTLRFMLAESLRLLPRSTESLTATVDHVSLVPDHFLLPASIAPYYNTRCGCGLVGAGLNERGDWSVSDEKSMSVPEEVACRTDPESLIARFSSNSGNPNSGEFIVDSPLGIVAKGEWEQELDSKNPRFILSNVRQEWFPGWRYPLRVALYFVRKIRRRKESWRWIADVTSDDDGKQMIGRWDVQ